MVKNVSEPQSVIFDASMVRVTLSKHPSSHKTQMREPILPQPELRLFDEMTGAQHWHWKDCNWLDGGLGMPQSAIEDYMPHKVGDILYVKEAWVYSNGCGELPEGYYYQADEGSPTISRWKSASSMPLTVARLFLKVTAVHVERLWDIEKYPFDHPNIPAGEIYHAKGYLNEGLLRICSSCYHVNGDCKDFINADKCKLKHKFKKTWNGKYARIGCSWNTNPWVVATTFERIDKPLNFPNPKMRGA